MPFFASLAAFSIFSAGPSLASKFHFEDVDRFVAAYERGLKGDLEKELDEGYLRLGSPGVKGFIVGRIQNAQALAEMVRQRPDAFANLRRKADAIRIQIPLIEDAFENLKRRYPKAVMPEVYFVVGRLNSGGTANSNGIILGIEHPANDPAWVVPLVSHEMVHFQQKGSPKTILEKSIHEGAADFIGELICGRLTPHAQETLRLARPRKALFWEEFRKDMDGTANQGRWLYNAGRGTKEWPSDLGYWIGYEICQALYLDSLDSLRSLAEIIEVRDYAAIYRRSSTDKHESPVGL